MEDCKNLISEDNTSFHEDVFDHPHYKNTCSLTEKEIIPYIHCNKNRCKNYEAGKE